MVNVLIIGAGGYLGRAVAQALLRSGHYNVFGTTRSEERGKILQAEEVTPLVGDGTKASFLTDAIAKHEIHIVIDSTQAYEEATAILNTVVSAGKARTAALTKENFIGPKLAFIYTSGSFVHGSVESRDDDLSPVGTSMAQDKPAAMVAWRPGHEQAVLASRDILDVAIIRPSNVYGRNSWVWSHAWNLVASATKDASAIAIPVSPDTTIPFTHVDDMAAAFLLVCERLPSSRLGSWPVFDITAETVRATNMMEGVADVYGVDKSRLEYPGPGDNVYFQALALKTNSDSARARAVLGWEAQRKDFLLNLTKYVRAWEAGQ